MYLCYEMLPFIIIILDETTRRSTISPCMCTYRALSSTICVCDAKTWQENKKSVYFLAARLSVTCRLVIDAWWNGNLNWTFELKRLNLTARGAWVWISGSKNEFYNTCGTILRKRSIFQIVAFQDMYFCPEAWDCLFEGNIDHSLLLTITTARFIITHCSLKNYNILL